jgi:hypothetical protein
MPNDSLPLLGKRDKARLASAFARGYGATGFRLSRLVFRVWRFARIEQKVTTRQSCNHTDKRWGPTPRYWSRSEDAQERRGSKNLSPRPCVTQRPLRAKNRLFRDLCDLLLNFLFSGTDDGQNSQLDERIAVESRSQKFSEGTPRAS